MSGYTWPVKVAISLQDELYERADEVASRLGINRSQLYARAVEQFLDAQGDDPVTVKLNELADGDGPGLGSKVGRALIDADRWEW